MEIIPEPEWVEILLKLKSHKGTSIIILGTTDSGKTTFIRYLIKNLLKDHHKLSLIDSDIGQSSLGLPGTICKKTFITFEDINDFRAEKISFIGSLNPADKIPLMIERTKKLVESSVTDSIETIIIDTTGLVSGHTGRALKIGKINAISPKQIIAIQRNDELEHILGIIEGITIHRLSVSKYVKLRSREKRIKYRDRCFSNYFKDPYKLEVLLNDVKILYNERPFDIKERYLKQGTLLGLNRNSDTIALGILDMISPNKISIITPLEYIQDVNRIVIGDIMLNEIIYENL